MGDVDLGTLYDMNKTMSAQEPSLKKHEIKDKIRAMADFYNKTGNATYHYYMLLCRERYDFTLFSNSRHGAMLRNSSFVQDLYECLTNRGEVVSIEETNDGAFEIWLRLRFTGDEEVYKEDFVYYFFPYDNGVIEIERK